VPLIAFFVPAAFVALVGALTGRVWLALLPLLFLWLSAFGGMSVQTAVTLMLLTAVGLLTLDVIRGARARRQPSA
jgi:hypothetical protein